MDRHGMLGTSSKQYRRYIWFDWKEEMAWLGDAIWSDTLLSSCSEARGPAGKGGASCRWVLMPGGRTGI